MITILILICVFITYCIGSYFTYDEKLRNSPYYFYIASILSIFVSFLWMKLIRVVNNTELILFYSLVWDILMIIAYYALPIIFQSKLNIQMILSSLVTIIGIFWFKLSIK